MLEMTVITQPDQIVPDFTRKFISWYFQILPPFWKQFPIYSSSATSGRDIFNVCREVRQL
jgi:hypothetical protein